MVGWIKNEKKIDGWWMDRKKRWMVGWIEKYMKKNGWLDGKKMKKYIDGQKKEKKRWMVGWMDRKNI